MYQYRVTKYDPALRDENGAFTVDAWTAFSDIGHSFNDVVLTEEEYLRVESSYIAIAASFMSEDGAPSLNAVGVEYRTRDPVSVRERMVVSERNFERLCRAVLRDEVWCRLEGSGRFVHFGYDYYMFVGVLNRCEKSVQSARSLGLFVEAFESPYLLTDEKPA